MDYEVFRLILTLSLGPKTCPGLEDRSGSVSFVVTLINFKSPNYMLARTLTKRVV